MSSSFSTSNLTSSQHQHQQHPSQQPQPQQHRWSRHDSGVSVSSITPACVFAGQSDLSIASLSESPFSSSSDSDQASSPRSVASSSAPSPASSIASSPFLSPAKGLSLSPVLDQLSLSGGQLDLDPLKPNPTQLAAYASSIVRNEAYALLALAARLAPAAQPIVEDEAPFAHHDLFPGPGFGAEDRASDVGSLDNEDSSVESRAESRSNIAFRNVIDALSSLPAHGKIVVTGVGKSGLVGRKMVATFCSLGIQSVFLHPLEALHGDLGVICRCSPTSPCDALLMISHSGATAELMRLLPIIRPRVRTLIAVTRDPDSVLARACAGWLDAGTGASTKSAGEKVTDEADSALPAPTSSVVAALAIGDAVALTLSKMRIGWGRDGKARRADFLRCHPGGQLGIEVSSSTIASLQPHACSRYM
ncbi:BZ3500_MvSof-1268-A1-R1_Chr1-3g01960 [Microbotryum saponariae]|uniref:BZ3500_MvSof-1268-A1-R1_Chr1-3g01960 protein n=1 Tax=Microbotryum saponariae TaxID=289078 RepID=A0A2X0L416_9BASI|nr:BZ3500_MvSof-1268-A1-R1_Chr1-3g01960 [Microbotryum saponariae]SCZ95026.1 BZ3501_MvSof-1269-A2-R1_Chr1-3g01562 [Microbotryum saponariae]